jgi:two-component system, chemotaxis family, protein-glutamate methylesterase/glutaminase
MIGVLVVDDSAFMRRAIVKMLESEDDIFVVGTARNGEEAVTKTLIMRPDVVTMDVDMPEVDGLEAVRRIVAQARVPIIMVSAHTHEGAEITFRALELGAVDFIAKPDAAYTNIENVARDLVEKVRGCVRAHVHGESKTKAHLVPANVETKDAKRAKEAARTEYACVAIGASTGGPVALTQIVASLPQRFPIPVLVVQHMPSGFTRPLADRLNGLARIRVLEGADGGVLQPATVTIAPAGKQIGLVRAKDRVLLQLSEDSDSLHVPSVDALCCSVADAYDAPGIGVVLTGMGRDGVDGLRRIKERGGYIVGQDEASCVVYGMPRAAALAGLVDRVAPLSEIADVLCGLVHTGSVLPQA